MIDQRMDSLLLRLDVPASPDPAYTERTLETLQPLVVAAARDDARPARVLRQAIRDLLRPAAGPWTQRRQIARVALLIALLLAIALALLFAIGSPQSIGNGLLIVAIDGQIQAIDPSGQAEPIRFGAAAEVTQLTRSPDGRSASLWIRDGAGYSLELLDLETGARRIFATDVPVDRVECIDVWSNDGQWLASAVRSGGQLGILVVDIRTGRGRLVTPPDMEATCPLWSPDSASIAFARLLEFRQRLWLMARDGSDAHEVSVDLADVEVAGANSFSPDGRWVYFDAHGPGAGENHIFRTDVIARRSERVTGDDLNAYAPTLSPDGRLVSFIVPIGSGFDLWVARADGSEPQLVLEDATSAGWSSDSQLLLAITADPATGPSGGLVTIRPDGSDLRVLVAFEGECGAGGPERCIDGVGWGQPRP